MVSVFYRLVKQGCYPSLYWRGNVWRFHVNAAGNYWADSKTIKGAIEGAVRLWESAGKPLDGYADTPDQERKNG